MKGNSKKELVIRSDTKNLVDVEKFIEYVFEQFELSDEIFFRCILSVKEAVTNSIIHGHKYDSEKKICIKAYRCSKYLYIKVIDEGEGFDYEAVNDPTRVEFLTLEGGRGLFFMKNMCDAIFFREKGNIVEFRINLHAGH